MTDPRPDPPGPAARPSTGDRADRQAALLAAIAENRRVAELSPSPFYVTLLDHMAEDVAEGGSTWALLEPFADEDPSEYYPFRVLAGVHLEVLAGERPGLAAHYPSVGGDGDAVAAWPGVRDAIADHEPEVIAELRHPLQTNETSRCGALMGGLCEVARTTGLPLRILELGSSGGLNLDLDRYRYEAGGLACGPTDSPVRFIDYWHPTPPPLDAAPRIVERRGCDLSPLDPQTEHDSLELQAYLWPDEHERLRTLRAAIAMAADRDLPVDRASADTWVAEQLREPAEGRATVVFHSVFWIYLPEEVQRSITDTIESAGGRASAAAPVSWLRFEEGADPSSVELRLRSWPGGEDRLLGTGRHHRHPIHWVAAEHG